MQTTDHLFNQIPHDGALSPATENDVASIVFENGHDGKLNSTNLFRSVSDVNLSPIDFKEDKNSVAHEGIFKLHNFEDSFVLDSSLSPITADTENDVASISYDGASGGTIQ